MLVVCEILKNRTILYFMMTTPICRYIFLGGCYKSAHRPTDQGHGKNKKVDAVAEMRAPFS